MASDRIPGTTSNSNIEAKVEWSSAPSPNGVNSSNLNVALYYRRKNSGFTTSGTGTFTIKIWRTYNYDSVEHTVTKSISITEDGWVKAAEYNNVIVKHRDDGYGSAKIEVSGSISGTSLSSTEVVGSITLDKIPRATTIDSLSCATDYFTGEMTYKYTPKSNGHYNICKVTLNIDGAHTDVTTIDIGQRPASQQTDTVTLSSGQLSTIYNALPTATRGTLRFTLLTYSDSGNTQVGDAGYKEIRLTIPNDETTKPTMDVSLRPADKFTLSNGVYVYVKSLSKVKATFSNAKSPAGATSFTYKLTVGGRDYGSPYVSDNLATAGDSVPIKATITDSRGYSRTYTEYRQVYDYTQPSINSITCSTDYFNGSITYKFTPANPNLHTRCDITLGSTTIRTFPWKTGSETTRTFTFEPDELKQIYELIPNGITGKLKFTLRAGFLGKDEDEITEAAVSREITLRIPDIDDTKPTADFSCIPVSYLGSPFDELYIRGKTQIQVNLSGGVGRYGASVPSSSYKVYVGYQSGTPPFTSSFISTSEKITVRGIVTDTRGFSRTYEEEITPIDYSAPRIVPKSGESEVIAARCNAAGELDANGTHLTIKAKREYSKVVVGNEQKNLCGIQFRYKENGKNYSGWTTILAGETASDEIVTGAIPGVTLATSVSYYVQIQAIDTIGDTGATTISISTEAVYMHRAGSINALGIGKPAEIPNSVDINPDWDIFGRVYGLGKAKTLIQSNENLNSYRSFGVFAVESNGVAETLQNCPCGKAGVLVVSSSNGTGRKVGSWTYILQEYITYDGDYYHRGLSTGENASEWSYQGWSSRCERSWASLGLSGEVKADELADYGRVGYGNCFYRVVNDNHVYVAFNCTFNYSGSAITVNKTALPEQYRPTRNVYALCPIDGHRIARIFVNNSGNILVDYVQDMAAASSTTSAKVAWIDGYIDYWV